MVNDAWKVTEDGYPAWHEVIVLRSWPASATEREIQQTLRDRPFMHNARAHLAMSISRYQGRNTDPLTEASRWKEMVAVKDRIDQKLTTLFQQYTPEAAPDPRTPRLQGPVTDMAGVLSVADRDRLGRMLAIYEQETSHQIRILVVATTYGESLDAFSRKIFGAWGIDRKGPNDGVLVAVAVKGGGMRIDVGSGMTKYISTATTHSILKDLMAPAFRNGDYAGGLQAGLEQLMKDGRQFVVTPADLQRSNER